MDIKQRNKKELGAVWRELKLQAVILFLMLGAMWIVVLADQYVDSFSVGQIGLQPRTLEGIPAIFYLHFLHLSTLHMTLCSLPFLVLGWLVMLRDTRDFIAVTLVSMVICGGSLWLFGKSEMMSGMVDVHWVGSGGLIMGYAGAILTRAIYERNWISIGVAALVMFLFGGSILTLLNPLSSNAFAAYLGAFVAGIITTRFMARFFKEKLTYAITDPEYIDSKIK